MNRLTYDMQIRDRTKGLELCGSARNPMVRENGSVEAICAVTQNWEKCSNAYACREKCPRYENFLKYGLEGKR